MSLLRSLRSIGLPILSVLFPVVVAASCTSDPDPATASPIGTPETNDASPANDASEGPVDVRILALNDFHGNLEPPTGSSSLVTVPETDPVVARIGADGGVVVKSDAGVATVPAGGAAFLATHVRELRNDHPNTIVVSAGDLTGASPLISSIFKDEPTILTMNVLGLDYNGVGNHEFDRGSEELLRLQKGGCSLGDCDAGTFAGAKFEYLAANVVVSQANATIFPPYAVKTFGTVKVGIIGLTLEATPTVTVEKAVAGLSFADEVMTVNALVPKLKAEGVSAIVVLLHQGGFQGAAGTYDSCVDFAGDLRPILEGDPTSGSPALDPDIDVVVSAHTHQPYNCVVNGRLVTSAASFGRVVTAIDLQIDPSKKTVINKSAKNVVVTRDVAADPDVSSILAIYQAQSATLANRVVGHVTSDIGAGASSASAACETSLGDLIADAQLAATSASDSGQATIAFMNPGGIRADIVYAGAGAEGAGAVTYAETYSVQPFANSLVTMTVTGAQLQTLLEQQFLPSLPRILQVSSGFTYAYTWTASTKTASVTDLRFNGTPIDANTNYRITVNSFLAGGGDGFTVLKNGTDRMTGITDVDALVAYLGVHDPISPPALTRITGNGCKP